MSDVHSGLKRFRRIFVEFADDFGPIRNSISVPKDIRLCRHWHTSRRLATFLLHLPQFPRSQLATVCNASRVIFEIIWFYQLG